MAPVSILAIGSYKSAAARVQPLCRDVVVGAGQPARLSGQRRHGGRRRTRLLSTRIFCTWAGREPRSPCFCQGRRRCVHDPRRWERRREDGSSKAKWVFCSSVWRMTDWQFASSLSKNKTLLSVCFTERVKSSEKIRAVSCGDETVVLLSEGGNLLCVDANQTSLVPRSEPTGLLLPAYALLPFVSLAYT